MEGIDKFSGLNSLDDLFKEAVFKFSPLEKQDFIEGLGDKFKNLKLASTEFENYINEKNASQLQSYFGYIRQALEKMEEIIGINNNVESNSFIPKEVDSFNEVEKVQ